MCLNNVLVITVCWLSLCAADDSVQNALAYMQARSEQKYGSLDIVKTYLPARVRSFIAQIKHCSLADAQDVARHDPDVDSSLFIISAKKRYHVIAFGRQDCLSPVGTGAASLDTSITVRDIIGQIVATAQIGVGFISYGLVLEGDPKKYYFVAYARTMEIEGEPYVVGASVAVPVIPTNFILQERCAALIKKIKREGWEPVKTLINNYPDQSHAFFVISLNFPNRWLATNEHPLLGLTLKDGAQFLSKHPNNDFDVYKFLKRMLYVAQHGGGFVVWPWFDARAKRCLRALCVQSLRINGEPCLIGAVHKAWSTTWEEIEKARVSAQRYKKMIEEIGIDNTVSVIKKDNRHAPYTYIITCYEPYTTFVHEEEWRIGLTAQSEAQKMTNKGFSLQKTFEGIADFALEEGEGYYTYPLESEKDGVVQNFLQNAYVVRADFKGMCFCIVCRSRALDYDKTETAPPLLA